MDERGGHSSSWGEYQDGTTVKAFVMYALYVLKQGPDDSSMGGDLMVLVWWQYVGG